MAPKKINTLVVGAGQAGIAASQHLSANNIDHIVLERGRIAERWRSERWDSLVTNGPVWHDRFPDLEFKNLEPDEFAPKEQVADYFEEYAKMITAPIMTGINVKRVRKIEQEASFFVETTDGDFEAENIIAATGAFQVPVSPDIVPKECDILQMHSVEYKNPESLQKGAVLVVGAGSSGAQIAEELLNSGFETYLSVGSHDRPPRRYRGQDFVWWLGVLGHWAKLAPSPKSKHVTIAVSGAYGGHTVDFCALAKKGLTLLGSAHGYKNGILTFTDDLELNIQKGNQNHNKILDEADLFVEQNGIEMPVEAEARRIEPLPDCVKSPIKELDLKKVGIKTIIWATGFKQDYSWLEVDTFDNNGRPLHERGISQERGIYFLGLPWQSHRGSSFIWGVWHDAKFIVENILIKRKYDDQLKR